MESLGSSFSDVSLEGDAPRKGKLSGIQCKNKDLSVSLHELVQKWNGLTIEGGDKIKQICELILHRHSQSESLRTGVTDQSVKENESEDTFNSLNDLSEDIETILGKMKEIVEEMKKITQTFNGIAKLVNFSGRGTYSLTSPVEQFYHTAQEITSSYIKELKFKGDLIKDLARLDVKQKVNFITLYWLRQPYILDKNEILLKSMVVECPLEK